MQENLTSILSPDNSVQDKVADHRVSSVVLNYNSDADLMISVPQLVAQKGVEHTVIIVDNASTRDCVQRTQAWLRGWCPDAVVGSIKEVDAWIRANSSQAQVNGRVFLVLNDQNRGYSAGNNVGIRLAETLGASAVLIANPDMRIDNQYYVAGLAKTLFTDEKHCIAASRIFDLEGKDQNPLRESTYWEEFLWPRGYFKSFFKQISYVLPISSQDPFLVPKVSGCCLMLRMDFLRATKNLDENVFLYCEEPILSARVKTIGGRIIHVPSISAVHAHVKSEKGNAGKRMLIFIKSRKYYLKTYSGYPNWQLHLLFSSYSILAFFNWIRSFKNK